MRKEKKREGYPEKFKQLTVEITKITSEDRPRTPKPNQHWWLTSGRGHECSRHKVSNVQCRRLPSRWRLG
jgi:hypothetical protein